MKKVIMNLNILYNLEWAKTIKALNLIFNSINVKM